MTRRLVVTGLSLMTDNIWTAYIHTDRDLNEQLLLKDSVYLSTFTVMPAKCDSDVMFCLQIYQGLITDGSLVY